MEPIIGKRENKSLKRKKRKNQKNNKTNKNIMNYDFIISKTNKLLLIIIKILNYVFKIFLSERSERF